MIISDSHKFVFIHIPRTGGVSTQNALKNYYDSNSLVEVRAKFQGPHYHSTFSQYQKIIREYFIWTRVRNPWDRVVSIYHRRAKCSLFIKNHNYFHLEAKNNSFKSWLNKIIERGDPKEFKWIFNQKRYLQEEKIDFIARFENINEDFSFFCKSVGLPDIKLPHKNGYRRKEYKSFYDNDLIDKLLDNDIFREDLNYLGYDYQP